MPLAPVIAAALNVGLPSRSKGLYLDGTDVLKQPGTGTIYGTPIDSVEVTEAGPGQVSSMSFDVVDPASAISVYPGMTVRFWDLTRDVPIFVGWVQTYVVSRMGVNRSVKVTCIGIEALLDWCVLPTLPPIHGQDYIGAIDGGGKACVAMLVAVASGFGIKPRVAWDTLGLADSTQAFPTKLRSFGQNGTFGASGDFDVSGMTLRQAIQAVFDAVEATTVLFGITVAAANVCTVDFYGGLRIWDASGNYDGPNPADYADTITFDTGGALKPSNLSHSLGMGDAMRSVYVRGAAGGSSGLVSDGTGLPGTTASLTVGYLLTASYVTAIGLNYLATNGITANGNVVAEDALNVGAQGSERRAGGTNVVITDGQVGLTAYNAPTNTFTKTYHGDGTEEWSIDYGSTVTLGSALLRRLTRSTLS